MTDNHPIDDELISAYLDGEVTPAERAVVEGDEAALARLQELSAVADAVARPVPTLPAADRERLLAVALDASDTSDKVTGIGTARLSSPRWRVLAVAAAVVAAVALAVPLARNADLGGDASDTASDAAADAPEAAEMSRAEGDTEAADEAMAATDASDLDEDDAASADMADEPAADEPADEPAEEPAEEAGDDGSTDAGLEFEPLPDDLGEFAAVDDLTTELETRLEMWSLDPVAAADVNRSDGVGREEIPCLEVLDVDGDGQEVDGATVTVDGVDHVVWVFEDGRVQLAPLPDCAPVQEILPGAG